MLQVRNICVSYGQVHILENVSLSVEEGSITCLIGANGAGKTTLLRTISGLLRPRTGEIMFHGAPIHLWPVEKIVKGGLVQVPESRDIFTKLTVYQNLLLGSYTVQPRKAVRGYMEVVMEYFPILRERSNQVAGTLSGGEMQMLAIGRALMAQPRLLVLDEPSQGLAPLVIEAIFDILAAINRNGTSILLVEQNAYKALDLASYGYVLQNGRIALDGRAKALKANEMVAEHYLGTS